MHLYAEMKLTGDGYAGGFSCGLTMYQSRTMEGFAKKSESPEAVRYENGDGVVLTVHKRQDGEALRTWTEVENNSPKEIAMELLTSFALKDVRADRIHRLQSFWSAEGKLRPARCNPHAPSRSAHRG